MDAFEFIRNYDSFINEIELVVKPDLLPLLEELRTTDPHDLVTPETWFPTDDAARGYIWSIFVTRAKKVQSGETRR